MSGTIPPEIGNLVNLHSLNLFGCNYEGSFPASFGNLKKLKTLIVYDNLLSGTLSSELVGMSELGAVLFEGS